MSVERSLWRFLQCYGSLRFSRFFSASLAFQHKVLSPFLLIRPPLIFYNLCAFTHAVNPLPFSSQNLLRAYAFPFLFFLSFIFCVKLLFLCPDFTYSPLCRCRGFDRVFVFECYSNGTRRPNHIFRHALSGASYSKQPVPLRIFCFLDGW